MSTDLIEKKILLRAPVARVWRALSDSSEFGHWFGVKFDGPFSPGAAMKGVMAGTKVDPEIAKLQKTHEGKAFNLTIDRMEPEKLFSFKWHPYAVEEGVDYSHEPMTLIVFALEPVAEGTMLTLTESGFDRIPLERRLKAFTANDRGWSLMVTVIARYVVQEP